MTLRLDLRPSSTDLTACTRCGNPITRAEAAISFPNRTCICGRCVAAEVARLAQAAQIEAFSEAVDADRLANVADRPLPRI
ncbi:hypothetical protein ACIBH1_44840 [Nonomuraea sp. NPDC050663]|uniref:hypothetical protein n=1 Tax=Nonomuraea sp. NPDC050663 TaxID=3364370 RepID=UPI003796261F